MFVFYEKEFGADVESVPKIMEYEDTGPKNTEYVMFLEPNHHFGGEVQYEEFKNPI